MAAGLGFKDFVTGEVLTAADVEGYLMQGIWVFASAAARSAAVTSPQEGNYSYLKDTNSTEYYTGSAWVAAGGGGGGKVLQVVQGTTTTETSTTSNSYIDTTLTASITPSSATSKVLVMTMQPFFFNRLTSGFEQGVQFKLLRGATSIVSQTTEPFRFLAYKYSDTSVIAFEMAALQSMVYLDSPATTSATTYKTQFNSGQSGQTATCQKASNPASIILMEIGA